LIDEFIVIDEILINYCLIDEYCWYYD